MRKKIEYLWMYYKVWLLIPILIIAAIYLGVTMYRGQQMNVVANVVIVGGNAMNEESMEELEEAFKTCLSADGKYDTVRIQANVPDDGGSINTNTALTTLVGAEAVDVLICSESIFREYEKQGGFSGNTLVLKGNAKEKFGVTYEDVYIGIMVNAAHPEEAKRIVEYLEKNFLKNKK